MDPITGEFVMGGVPLRPLASKASVLASALGQGAVERKKGGAWSTVRLAPQSIGTKRFVAILSFHGDELVHVNLADDDPRFGTSFDDADEPGRKASHDAWLLAILGPPPYAYPWGEITSNYDPRSVSSSILIDYAPGRTF